VFSAQQYGYIYLHRFVGEEEQQEEKKMVMDE
jgi:hypothetical protein